MFFNRYTSNISYVRNALNKNDIAYCDPSNYYVTKEECLKYLDDVATGQKNNDNWNSRRKKWVVNTTITLCIVLSVILIIVSLYFLHKYAEGWEIAIIPIVWIVLGCAVGVYNLVEEKYRLEDIWRSDLFPPVNEKIEKLFDDYLWKVYIREEENKNNKEGSDVPSEQI